MFLKIARATLICVGVVSGWGLAVGEWMRREGIPALKQGFGLGLRAIRWVPETLFLTKNLPFFSQEVSSDEDEPLPVQDSFPAGTGLIRRRALARRHRAPSPPPPYEEITEENFKKFSGFLMTGENSLINWCPLIWVCRKRKNLKGFSDVYSHF